MQVFLFQSLLILNSVPFDRVDVAVKKFVSLYNPGTLPWENISQIAQELDFTNALAQSAAEHFDIEGVHRLYSREIVEASTRVNYAHVSGGKTSLALCFNTCITELR